MLLKSQLRWYPNGTMCKILRRFLSTKEQEARRKGLNQVNICSYGNFNAKT